MKRKTIVFCCNSLWGLVNFRGRVIEALVRDGHRVVLIAREDAPVEQVSAIGAEFLDWNISPRGIHPWDEARSLLSMWRMYRRLAPDLAFHFTVKPVMYGAFVAWLMGIRCVSIITGLGYLFLADNWKSKIGKSIYRLTLRRSHQVWFLNDDDREFFASAGLTDGLTVRALPGEGIDVARFTRTPLPQENVDFVFLMIARLVKDKGVVEFAEAARAVKARHPHVTFRLLGPSYPANTMSVAPATVDEWVKQGTIEYLGSATDVRTAIADCHCVVLPSYREGMPRVLMEAAAMGRPVIATDVTGCRDVVAAELTGLLCKPRDADSLAKSCIVMLGLAREQFESMSDHAHQLAHERFDDRIVINIYKDLVRVATA